MTILYEYENGLYVNLTNTCTCSCTFCIRLEHDGVSTADSLWLERDPSTEEVLAAFAQRDLSKYDEVVFCGYGEPTERLEQLIAACRYIRSVSDIPIRINTNGLANLEYGEDITPKLAGCIDIVSISLNAPTAEEYDALCRPAFGQGLAHKALIEFAKAAKAHVHCVVMTVVDVIGPEAVEVCRKIAENAGVNYRVRPMEAL